MNYEYDLVYSKTDKDRISKLEPKPGYRFVGCTPPWKSSWDGHNVFYYIFEKEVPNES